MKDEITPSKSQAKQNDLPQVQPEPVKVIKLFISYSHKDIELLAKLLAQLSSLRRLGVVKVWYDGDIVAGGSWKEEIDENLNDAHIVLLLISPDFLASDYCYEKELPRAMERHDQGEAEVIPVILRPCVWDVTPLGSLQALPVGGQPSTTWPNQDEAFADVVQGVWGVAKKLLQRPDKSALQAMMDIPHHESIIPLQLKQLSSYYIIRFKPVILALLVTFIPSTILLALWLRPAIEYKMESHDPILEKSLVEYVSEGSSSPVQVGWQIGRFDGVNNRLIKGEKIGLFKDEKARSAYNLYQDFILEFDVRFPAGKGVAWVVRAKDFQNYYLFELAPSVNNSQPQQATFVASIYQNGFQKKVFNIQEVYVDVSPSNEPVRIKMKALGNEFNLCIASFRSAPNLKPLEKFYDPDKTFSYGGVGFAPRSGMEVRLAYFHVKPDNQPVQNICQKK